MKGKLLRTSDYHDFILDSPAIEDALGLVATVT